MRDHDAGVGVDVEQHRAASAGAPATSAPTARRSNRRCRTCSTSRCISYAGRMSQRLEPVDVARHVVAADELLRAERERHRRQALLRHAAAVLVDRVRAPDATTCGSCSSRSASGMRGSVVERGRVGRRYRPQQLPALGHPVRGDHRRAGRTGASCRCGARRSRTIGARSPRRDPRVGARRTRELEPHLEQPEEEPARRSSGRTR